jgi:hypothetical protein
MIVEMRNCSIEIAYICTREQIQMEMIMTNWPEIYRQLCAAIQTILDAVVGAVGQISDFLNSDDGKKMLIGIGIT